MNASGNHEICWKRKGETSLIPLLQNWGLWSILPATGNGCQMKKDVQTSS